MLDFSTRNWLYFGAGLEYGLIALFLGAVVAIGWRARTDLQPAPIAGLLLVGGALQALPVVRSVDLLWPGLGLLALGGVLAPKVPYLSIFLALPGAVWIAFWSLTGAGWISWFVLCAVIAGAVLVADFERYYNEQALAPTLVTITILGMFSTLPDGL